MIWGGVSHALTARHSATGRYDPNGETWVAHTITGGGFDASEDGTGRGTPIVPVAIIPLQDVSQHAAKGGREGGSQFEGPHETANIRAANGGSSRSYIAFDETQITNPTYRVNPQPDDPCFTLHQGRAPTLAFQSRASADNTMTPSEISPSLDVGKAGGMSVFSNWRVRRLTPLECERLQGFPDGYTRVPYRKKPAADGPRYRALGNSMAVNCMRWLFRRIEMVDAIKSDAISSDRCAS